MRMDRIISKLQRAIIFSKLDVRFCYYNIRIAKDRRKYTFFTAKYGMYGFLQIPFSIHVTPRYFTLMINETLKELEICFAYLDDIITLSTLE